MDHGYTGAFNLKVFRLLYMAWLKLDLA